MDVPKAVPGHIQEGRSGKEKGYQVEQFLVQYEETKNEKV